MPYRAWMSTCAEYGFKLKSTPGGIVQQFVRQLCLLQSDASVCKSLPFSNFRPNLQECQFQQRTELTNYNFRQGWVELRSCE